MKNTIRSMLESCTEDAVRRAEGKFMGEPVDDNEYIMLQVKYGNYALRWMNGTPVPSSVMKRVSTFFKDSDLPKMWYPLVDAIEKQNPKQMEAL